MNWFAAAAFVLFGGASLSLGAEWRDRDKARSNAYYIVGAIMIWSSGYFIGSTLG